MLSFLMCSRKKNNPDSNLPDFFQSAVEKISEKDQVEFVIKFDSDDDERVSDLQLSSYPFKIKTFSYSRGEGRHSLHNDYSYLFAQRNPNSRFCCIVTDDCIFMRNGFVSEILSIPDEICFVGSNRPNAKEYINYREENIIEGWKFDISTFPCVSTKAIEITQNFGWHANVDNWITLMHIILVNNYDTNVWNTINDFTIRSGGLRSGYSSTYNNMEIDGSRNGGNPYYFNLVEQQVKNLYLNLKEVSS